MRKTNIVRLTPGKEQKAILKAIGDRSSALYNAGNYLCRQAFIRGDKVPSYSALCATFKGQGDYEALPTHIGQEVLKKLAKAWTSCFKLRKLHAAGKLQHKPGLPQYRKDRKTKTRPWDYIPVKSANAYRIVGNELHLAMPEDLQRARMVIPFRGIIRHQGEFKTCELKYDRVKRAWYAHLVMGVADQPLRIDRMVEKHAAGDIGARRAITVSIDGQPMSMIYSSRAAWKDYKYWIRHIATEKSRLSGQGKKTSRQLQALYRMRRLRLRHALQTLALDVITMLRKHKVTHFTVGYPINCRDNAKFGKGNELVHNFWCFDTMLDMLEICSIRAGIVFERIGERGTSSHCHICGKKVRRPQTDTGICPVHGRMHADVNASLNILRKKTKTKDTPASVGDGAQAAPAWKVKRWNSHRWLEHAESAKHRVLMTAA